MRRFVLGLGIASVLIAGARAQTVPPVDPAYVKLVECSPIINRALVLAAGTHKFETRNLTGATADTMLFLVGPTGATVGFNDDRVTPVTGQSQFSSFLQATTVAGAHQLIVISQDNAKDGKCDVVVDGVSVLTQVAFGGAHVYWPWVTNDVFQTAHVATGAKTADTELYAFNGNTFVQRDGDGGVGLCSRMKMVSPSTAGAKSQIIVGTHTDIPANRGQVRVVRNNLGKSPSTGDNDGLSDELERNTSFLNPNSADSDGDGLPDDWELLGVQTNSGFVDLPAFGADPSIKQAFFELDIMAAPPGKPANYFNISSQAITLIQNMFAAAGVQVIIDTGNLGTAASRGGQTIPYQATFDNTSSKPTNVTILSKDPNFFAPERRRIFIYGVIGSNFTSPGVGGQATQIIAPDGSTGLRTFRNLQPIFMTCIQDGWPSATNQAHVTGHEMGHTIGLGHGGDVDTNGKPNYLSAMNYLYAYVGTDKSFVPSFSKGTRAPIQENAAVESAGIGTCTDYVYTIIARNYAKSSRRISTTQPNAIDWNKNGALDTAPVSYDVDPFDTFPQTLKDVDDGAVMASRGFLWTAFAVNTPGYRSFK